MTRRVTLQSIREMEAAMSPDERILYEFLKNEMLKKLQKDEEEWNRKNLTTITGYKPRRAKKKP